MPYTPTVWSDNAVPLVDAAGLNNIEDGLVALDAVAPVAVAADDLPDVWTVDADGVPIAADAGTYVVNSRALGATEITITVGDDAAAIHTALTTPLAALLTQCGYVDTDVVVTGDWSQFTVSWPLPVFGWFFSAYGSTMTLAAAPVDDPVAVQVAAGHGTYTDDPTAYGDVLGRATTESAFGAASNALIDPRARHFRDGAWIDRLWQWSNGTVGVRDLMGGTFDWMDVQQYVSETQTLRFTGRNTQAYADGGLEAVRTYSETQINRDGTGASASHRLESDHLDGEWKAELTDNGVTETSRAHTGQTAPQYEAQAADGAPAFRVGADGQPQIKSPDGTWYVLTVANGGALSTTPA